MSSYNLDTQTYKVNEFESRIESDNEFKPFVRFADENAKQEPELIEIHNSIPDNASFASPIYFLNQEERNRLNSLENPYAVSDSNIAKELQDKVENDRREYYPIYIESDSSEGLEEQIDWIEEFCREYLKVPSFKIQWYYSGNRSIHAHIPKLAKQKQLKDLRDLAKQFQYDLDAQIYTKKRQFRLPGVTHEGNNFFSKVEIEPEWCRDRIIKEASQSVSKPETFAEVLFDTFGNDILTSPEDYLWTPKSENKPINSGQKDDPTESWSQRKYESYYNYEVSPYALSRETGNRSLLVAKVIGRSFAEKRESNGNSNEREPQTFVPCEIYNFWACNRDFEARDREFRPIQLSKPDYKKFDKKGIEKGDFFVLIGGQSRKSRIFKPKVFESKCIGGSKTFREGIETLEAFGYKTGESGINPSNFGDKDTPENNTRSYKLQKQAEKEGIDTLSHGERLLVMLRRISIDGIEGTREWFKKLFGDRYDESLTNKHIKSACEKYEWTPSY